MPLSTDDLAWIMTILRSIAPKWKEVLIELGTSNDQVLSAMDSSTHPPVRLRMGLSRWLGQTSPRPTVGALARALRSKAVGEIEKASEIMKGKHCYQFVVTYSYEYFEEASRHHYTSVYGYLMTETWWYGDHNMVFYYMHSWSPKDDSEHSRFIQWFSRHTLPCAANRRIYSSSR